MEFYLRRFDELTVGELHEIFALRARVFVVEQNCVYEDPDGKDLYASHVMGHIGRQLVAYCRIVQPGYSYAEPSIGRVVVAREHRGTGLGRRLMRYAVLKTRELYPACEIVISAQTYLERFYTELGFTAEGAGYLEDGIPHRKMRLKAASRQD